MFAIATPCCSVSKNNEIAERMVVEFHSQLDAEQYHEIYIAGDEEFRKSGSESELVAFLSAVHKKLGKTQQTKEMGYYVNVSTLGTTVTLTYATEFAEGKATEQFIWRIRGDQGALLRYDVNSPILITR